MREYHSFYFPLPQRGHRLSQRRAAPYAFERLTYLRNLEDKKNQVLGSIEEQGKLTPELKKQILEAQTLVVVEDLYRPYRPKRRTRATIAKEKAWSRWQT